MPTAPTLTGPTSATSSGADTRPSRWSKSWSSRLGSGLAGCSTKDRVRLIHRFGDGTMVEDWT